MNLAEITDSLHACERRAAGFERCVGQLGPAAYVYVDVLSTAQCPCTQYVHTAYVYVDVLSTAQCPCTQYVPTAYVYVDVLSTAQCPRTQYVPAKMTN